MAKEIKKGKKEIEAVKEEDDKTIIYMIIGFCLGAVIALLCFEYYWVGVGGGAGMLLGILVSTVVDFQKSKVEKPVAKSPVEKSKNKSKKVVK